MSRATHLVVCAIAVCVAIACAAGAAGCSRSTPTQAAASASTTPAAPSPVLAPTLSSAEPAVVGTLVHATASGLPAGKTVDLGWGTVNGGWVVEDYYHFRGKKYVEAMQSLGNFPIDANGRLDARFAV